MVKYFINQNKKKTKRACNLNVSLELNIYIGKDLRESKQGLPCPPLRSFV